MLWVVDALVLILTSGKVFRRVFVKITGQSSTGYVVFELVIDQF